MATRIISVSAAIGIRSSMTLITALLSGLFGPERAAAQDSVSVTVDIADCIELESAAARVECFGSQVDAVLEAQGEAEERDAATESGAAAAAERSGEESSSRPERRVRRDPETRPEERAAASAANDGEFFGTVVSFEERIPFSYVITLDNGQVWEQVEPKRYPLRPGLEVRIYPTRWGSTYRLAGEGTGGHIRVRRVQ